MHPVVAALPLEEKGLVLGAMLARMSPEDFATRFGGTGSTGSRCRVALEALAAEPRSGRAAALAALLALVREPVPAGIERIDPGQLRERLAAESTAVIRAVTDGMPVEVRRVADEILSERGEDPKGPTPTLAPPGVVELRRAVFAGLVPIGGTGIPADSAAQALLPLSFAALEEAIELRGAETLGTSLQGAPASVVARAAAGLGGRMARVVLDAAAQTGPTPAREAARRVIAAAAVDKPADEDLAWDLGARALAAGLADEGDAAVRAVAQRLPPKRGQRWLAYAAKARG